ncbi:hypothetical protein MTsDn1_26960 [Alteromonas sp. MTD1]
MLITTFEIFGAVYAMLLLRNYFYAQTQRTLVSNLNQFSERNKQNIPNRSKSRDSNYVVLNYRKYDSN